MTQTKAFDVAVNVPIIGMILVVQVVKKLFILKIHICNAWLVLLLCGFLQAVLERTDGNPFKLHDVLCEGAGFVRKNVVDHTKFLIQI